LQYLTEKKRTIKRVRRLKGSGDGNVPMTLWSLTVTYINNVKINETFKRQELFNGIRNLKTRFFYQCVIHEPTIDTYRMWLTSSEFIEKTENPGVYKKLQDIPEDLTITKLRKYLYGDSWKKWFIPREESLGTKKEKM